MAVAFYRSKNETFATTIPNSFRFNALQPAVCAPCTSAWGLRLGKVASG
jgi:hypothetical protein